MLRNILAKYHYVPGFMLLLGGILRYMNAEDGLTFLLEIKASLYLGHLCIWAVSRGRGISLMTLGYLDSSYSISIAVDTI